MLVTFRTKAHADITMFGDVAIELLKLAGMSGTVPSAILAADISAVRATLEEGLAQRRALPEKSDGAVGTAPSRDPEAERPVPLDRRAWPLLELLRHADAAGADVLILASR